MKKTENGYPYFEENDSVRLDTYTKELTERIEENTSKTPIYKGNWRENEVYKKFSVVIYERNAYIAKVDEVPAGTLPTNNSYYDLYIDNSTSQTLEKRIDTLEKNLSDIKEIENLKSIIIKDEILQSEENSLIVENTAKGLKAQMIEIASNKLYQKTCNKNNLYNIKDVKTFGTGVSVDNEDWITITCDNTEGTSTIYQNCYTFPSSKLIDNTQYYFVLEVKSISGTGNLHIIESIPGTTESQFQGNQSYGFTDLKSNTIYKFQKKSKEDLDIATIISMCKTFCSFSAGQNGSITYRLSIYENQEYSTDFSYESYGIYPSFEVQSQVEGITGDLIVSSYFKNLYNVKDVMGKDVTIDDEDWIIVNYDNTEGTAIRFKNFFTKYSNIIKPAKEYYLVIEVAEASGTGVLSVASKVSGNDISQFKSGQVYQISDLHSGDIIIKKLVSNDNMNGKEKCLRNYFQFNAGQRGSCKIRISLLEKEPSINTFHYIKFYGQEIILPLNTTLYGNNLAKDGIFFKDNKWQFYRNWHTIFLNGTEDWVKEQTSSGKYRYRLSMPSFAPVQNNNTKNAYSDKLNSKTALETWSNKEGISVGYHLHIYLDEFSTDDKTLTQFKQFLSENPVTVTYMLKNTIYEEITDSMLLEQLNKLLSIEQYDDSTNISFNQETIFKVEVGKDKLNIANKKIEILEQVILSLGGNI